MIKNIFNKMSFTLIELLVIIAIIGILAGIIIISMSGAQNLANDARRKADINQLAKKIIIYKLNDSEALLPITPCTIGGGETPCTGTAFNDFSNFIDPNGSSFYAFTPKRKGNYIISTTLSTGENYCFDSSTGTYLTGSCPLLPEIDGDCGSADGWTFAPDEVEYGSYTQCDIGSSSNIMFPSQGGSQTWTCSGSNGGDDVSCIAYRAPEVPFCSIPAHYNSSKVVSGDNIWCDNYGGLWTNIISTGMSCYDGISYCSNLNYAGMSGWALPSRDHLLNCLYSSGCRSSHITATWWSSTIDVNYTNFAYYINFSGGPSWSAYMAQPWGVRCRLGE
jgi:type II secretory pathway pseudopilin PulG